MSVARYEPWNVMSHLQGEINRIFSNASDVNNGSSSSATADWAPPVDINEYPDRFELYIDLPGVDPKSVEITLDNDVLTLSGERAIARRASEEQQVVRQRIERSHGRFHRRFILPETVDTERVSAKGRDGVLELTIAKQARAQPRRISVGS
jgi:HSP20 family protein